MTDELEIKRARIGRVFRFVILTRDNAMEVAKFLGFNYYVGYYQDGSVSVISNSGYVIKEGSVIDLDRKSDIFIDPGDTPYYFFEEVPEPYGEGEGLFV